MSVEESSIDIVSLNNLVVNLRSFTKKSKAQVIQRLNKTIKALQQRGNDPNDKRHKRATKLLDELKILKATNVDEITKFCLIQSGASRNDAKTKEQAAMIRMASHKVISGKIKELQKEHNDWDSLVFYIKNHVPRRVKKKSSKKLAVVEAEKSSKSKMRTSVVEKESNDQAEEDHCESPITPEKTMAKLKNFGGVVHAFTTEDDCDFKCIITSAPTEECKDKAKETCCKASKSNFFEGSDGNDEINSNRDSENENTNSISENDKKQHLFKMNVRRSNSKPFAKKYMKKDKQNHFNTDKSVSEVREKKLANNSMESLHPSWEAKRREKEMMKSLRPQSTKIVFDD